MSFEIKNFKCFPELRLEQVGDLNLIAGKNNVGKTTVLEAVAILASGADPSEMFRVVDEREAPKSEAELVSAFKSLFGEDCVFSADTRSVMIAIPSWRGSGNAESQVGLNDFRKDPTSKLAPTFSISAGFFQYSFDLTLESRTAAYGGRFQGEDKIRKTMTPIQKTAALYSDIRLVKALWDETNARPAEDDLLDLLRLLEPRVKRITLSSAAAIPEFRIRLDNEPDLTPLSRYGDGMSRLVYLGLALVNCGGGYLLADEIENGLHHSLFPKLWDFLFAACKRLNVTLFATTHSQDATTSFSEAAMRNRDAVGVLTRLQRRNGKIIPIQFTEEEALMATREGLEVR